MPIAPLVALTFFFIILMNVERCWEQYYKTLKLIYLEENKETCQREIDHLVDTAIELKEKTYSNAVLDLGRQFREVCPKARIMWKTSSIAGNTSILPYRFLTFILQ